MLHSISLVFGVAFPISPLPVVLSFVQLDLLWSLLPDSFQQLELFAAVLPFFLIISNSTLGHTIQFYYLKNEISKVFHVNNHQNWCPAPRALSRVFVLSAGSWPFPWCWHSGPPGRSLQSSPLILVPCHGLHLPLSLLFITREVLKGYTVFIDPCNEMMWKRKSIESPAQRYHFRNGPGIEPHWCFSLSKTSTTALLWILLFWNIVLFSVTVQFSPNREWR